METTPALREQLERGLTLPASWYSDPEVLRLEQERIFRRTLAVRRARPRSSPSPARSSPARPGDVPVVVVARHDEGDLRGFVNVCRHRGHEVAEGCGRRETLQCPYHAWTYGLDGSLRAAPRSEREPGFDRADWSLRPVRVETWGPLVFVNPDLDAAPLAETLGEPAAGAGRPRARPVGARVPRPLARLGDRGELEDRRRELPRVLPLPGRAQELQPADRRRSRRVPADDRAAGRRASTARHRAGANGTGLPYEPIGRDPGQPVPLRVAELDAQHASRAGRTCACSSSTRSTPSARRRSSTASGRPARATRSIDEITEFGSVVGAEDVDLVESVHRGLRSGAIEQGRLLLDSEQLIQHFQLLVHDALVV